MGIYKDDQLIETVSTALKTSEGLLPLLTKIMNKYTISNIIYTRGPGSYMAIKITYIMLKTIEIVKGIQCFGCSAFTLNEGNPIKAIGNLYFFKEKETILTKKLEQFEQIPFTLPQSIQDLVLDEESVPDYVIPAV